MWLHMHTHSVTPENSGGWGPVLLQLEHARFLINRLVRTWRFQTTLWMSQMGGSVVPMCVANTRCRPLKGRASRAASGPRGTVILFVVTSRLMMTHRPPVDEGTCMRMRWQQQQQQQQHRANSSARNARRM